MDYKAADILLVEDSMMDVELLLRSLERKCILNKITTVSTCKAAIKKCQDTHFDVVILDINLPDGSGVDLISDLKATPGAKDSRFIALTAFASDSEFLELSRRGVDAYCTKLSGAEGLAQAFRELEGVGLVFAMKQGARAGL
jgi:DNA-binding NarL/FixJ family response regulator